MNRDKLKGFTLSLFKFKVEFVFFGWLLTTIAIYQKNNRILIKRFEVCQMETLSKQLFKDNIKNGVCPFCLLTLKYYDGALGYEADICEQCGLTVDNNGIHLDSEVQ